MHVCTLCHANQSRIEATTVVFIPGIQKKAQVYFCDVCALFWWMTDRMNNNTYWGYRRI